MELITALRTQVDAYRNEHLRLPQPHIHRRRLDHRDVDDDPGYATIDSNWKCLLSNPFVAPRTAKSIEMDSTWPLQPIRANNDRLDEGDESIDGGDGDKPRPPSCNFARGRSSRKSRGRNGSTMRMKTGMSKASSKPFDYDDERDFDDKCGESR